MLQPFLVLVLLPVLLLAVLLFNDHFTLIIFLSICTNEIVIVVPMRSEGVLKHRSPLDSIRSVGFQRHPEATPEHEYQLYVT